jgi:hypothetical protein
MIIEQWAMSNGQLSIERQQVTIDRVFMNDLMIVGQ